MKIIIILPTYNEAENLPILIERIFSLGNQDINILVVDDNSPDGTGKLAKDLSHKYQNRIEVLERPGKLGLGSAYIDGFHKALNDGADIIGQMDSDFSHPPEKIPELLDKLITCDVVLGSRYISGGGVDENWPLWRKALSRWGNFYARTILSLPINDVTGGFRLWKANTLRSFNFKNIKSNGYIFLVELLYLSHKAKYKFGEVPFYFNDRKWGNSKMNLSIQIEAAWRVWYLLIYYWIIPPKFNIN